MRKLFVSCPKTIPRSFPLPKLEPYKAFALDWGARSTSKSPRQLADEYPACSRPPPQKKLTIFSKLLTSEHSLASCEQFSEFKAFMRACEHQEACHGLDLRAYLIQPVQRVPRYRLLLIELLKHTRESHPDWVDLKAALENVRTPHGRVHKRIIVRTPHALAARVKRS